MPILHDEEGQDDDTLSRRIKYGAISFMLMAILLAGMAPTPTYAHGGGLAADGCHYDRKAGTRHCHGGARPAPTSQPLRARGGEVYYPNCAAARNAGAVPVRRGEPGYARHLDRDGDGVGCE